MKRKVLILLVCCILIFSNFAISSAATVKFYNTYTTKGNLTKSGYSHTQSLALGSTYAYSAKINDDETKSILLRTNMNTGTTEQLMNGDNATDYATYMGHANDMAGSNLNGKSHLFIVTAKAASNNLVKVKIDGTKFYKVGQFTFKYAGKTQIITGIHVISKTTSKITFLCKNGRTYFTGDIGLNSNSGNIQLTKKFTINVADALVNGKKVSDLASYTNQSMCYSGGNLYVPLWGGGANKKNISVVLVYRNVKSSTTGKLNADPNLSFRITSSAYPTFEIEGCGVADGKLWFNTNRRNTSNVQSDGLHYFDAYSQ